MKIILVCMYYDYGDPSRGVSYEYNTYHAPLVNMGHEVTLFDFMSELKQHGKQEMNRRLLELAQSEKPDAMVFALYKDEFEVDTLEKLRQVTKTFCFFQDDTWRVDYTKEAYRPVGLPPDQPGIQPGYVDFWVGDPWATVYDEGATRNSFHRVSYNRTLPLDQVKMAFPEAEGIEKLKGSDDLPSASRFQQGLHPCFIASGRRGASEFHGLFSFREYCSDRRGRANQAGSSLTRWHNKPSHANLERLHRDQSTLVFAVETHRRCFP